MTKKIINLAFLSVLATSSLSAKEMIFDLFAQDYKESLTESPSMNKYKVNDSIIVETNLIKKDLANYYRYHRDDTLGHFNLYPTKVIKNWTYKSDITFNDTSHKKYIEITDEVGEKFLVTIFTDAIDIENIRLKANTHKERVRFEIEKKDDVIAVIIDGKKVYEEKIKLNLVRKINTNINYLYSNTYDTLYDLKLINND